MANHRVWSPDCPFVCGKNCGNVFTTMLSTGQDTCDQYGIEIRPNSFPERESGSTSNNRFNVSKMGVQPHRRPAYAGYVTLEQRLNLFAGWTHSINQRPEQLAAAGFFYNGKKDQTICFHCGGGLKDWEVDDNPWEQHAKWFSKCNFVLLQKGSEYISEMYSKELSVLQIHPVSSLNITPVNHSKTDTSSTPSVLEVTVTEPKRIETKERGLENDKNINTFCKVCYAQEVSVVFLPCGHMFACVDCALALTTCAVCCKPVEATVGGFLQ